MSLHEEAARKKWRFCMPGEGQGGRFNVEDLWNMPLEANSRVKANLNDIAIGLHTELQATTISFVGEQSARATDKAHMLDLVKHIIKVRLDEGVEAQTRIERERQKQKLLAILDRKKEGELEGKSIEELEAMAAAL